MTVLWMRPAVCILVALAVLDGGGCRRSTREEDSRREIAQAFGRLPGLTETPDPKLRAELARIIEEGATPELLAQTEIPEEENAAEVLAELFQSSEIESILDRSAGVLPSDGFRFSPTDLEKAIRFRAEYEAQRRRARDALRRPACRFDLQYEAGFAAELSFIDVLRISARLEAFRAAESLAGDDLAAAIESLSYMFRLAACLAREKHATTRLQAAFLREEALNVLQGIVEHPQIGRPKITQKQLGRLYAMVQGQLKAWTPDRDAWIGDRALGMHSYELVRAGRVWELLTEEEVEQFTAENILEELPAAAKRIVNQDELYYLEAMRKIIDACSRPYYQRTEVFESLRKDLHQKRNSPEFPLVAGRLLLPGIEKGHAIQARDRAGCEAWALALAMAAGEEPPPYQVSPLTGEKYQIDRQRGTVMVWRISPDEYGDAPPVVVPDLAGKEPEK